jgi:hypothetical protein
LVNNRRDENALPKIVNFDSVSSNNGQDIVNLYASYFFKAYCNSTHTNFRNNNLNDKIINSTFSFNKLKFTEIDIFNLISSLPLISSSGPDGIPPVFFYNCIFVLTPILTIIFNTSLNIGIFLELWKTSFVFPVFKKGDPSSISNYICISKLSATPKLFSNLISSKLTAYRSLYLFQNQHGFISKRSSCTNLSLVQNLILNEFNSNSQTDIIYTDFSKAFDRVNLEILFYKLQYFRFSDPLLSWFRFFLTNRFQIVKYQNYCSPKFSVPSGGP